MVKEIRCFTLSGQSQTRQYKCETRTSLAYARLPTHQFLFTLSNEWLLVISTLALIARCDYFVFCISTIEK